MFPTNPEEKNAFFEKNRVMLNMFAMNYDTLVESMTSSTDIPQDVRESILKNIRDFMEYSTNKKEKEDDDFKKMVTDLENIMSSLKSLSYTYTPFSGDRETHIRLSRKIFKNTPHKIHDFVDVYENDKRHFSMFPKLEEPIFEEFFSNAKKNIPENVTFEEIIQERFPTINSVMKLVRDACVTTNTDYDSMSDDEVIECYESSYKSFCESGGLESIFNTSSSETFTSDETKLKLGEALLPLIGDVLTEYQQLLKLVETPYTQSAVN